MRQDAAQGNYYEAHLVVSYAALNLLLPPFPLPLSRCDKKQLRESLITRTLVTREGNIKRDLDPTAAVVSRDTLAKTIYARLFDW